MAERILVTTVKRINATAADLYGARHKYADLRLFDVNELAAVGIDPATLAVGVETPARFWALYQLSSKLNKVGNPYKDIIALEPVTAPATTTSAAVADASLLGELRAIRALLEILVDLQGLPLPRVEYAQEEQDTQEPDEQEPDEQEPDADPTEPAALATAFPRYADGSPVSNNAHELAAYQLYLTGTGQPPLDIAQLRAWVKAQEGPRPRVPYTTQP